MRKKFLLRGFLIFLLFIIIYFVNIEYAFICGSESIDKHIFNTMIQGKLHPIKEHTLLINNKVYRISLPKNAGKLSENEYLVPNSSLINYKNQVIKTNWNFFEQTGTSIWIKNQLGDSFNISIRPFTGAYLILTYSSEK